MLGFSANKFFELTNIINKLASLSKVDPNTITNFITNRYEFYVDKKYDDSDSLNIYLKIFNDVKIVFYFLSPIIEKNNKEQPLTYSEQQILEKNEDLLIWAATKNYITLLIYTSVADSSNFKKLISAIVESSIFSVVPLTYITLQLLDISFFKDMITNNIPKYYSIYCTFVNLVVIYCTFVNLVVIYCTFVNLVVIFITYKLKTRNTKQQLLKRHFLQDNQVVSLEEKQE